MSKIDINNYESFALDYLEGTMSAEDRKAFDGFLQQHPTIAEEMSDLMTYQLEPAIMPMPNKQTLTRPKTSDRALRRYAPFLLLLLVIGGLIALWPTKDSEQLAEQSKQATKQVILPKVNQAASVAAASDIDKYENNEAEEAALATSSEEDINKTEHRSISNDRNAKKVEANTENQKPKQLNKSNEATYTSEKLKDKSQSNETNKTPNTNNTPGRSNDNVSPGLETPSTSKSMTTKEEDFEKEKKQVEPNEVPKKKEQKIELEQKIIEERVVPAATKDSIAMESPTLEKIKQDLNLSKKKTKKQTPIAIQPELSEESDEIAIATAEAPDYKNTNKKNKQKKSFFKKLIPEAIAGLTKDELKRSFVPEAIARAK